MTFAYVVTLKLITEGFGDEINKYNSFIKEMCLKIHLLRAWNKDKIRVLRENSNPSQFRLPKLRNRYSILTKFNEKAKNKGSKF